MKRSICHALFSALLAVTTAASATAATIEADSVDVEHVMMAYHDAVVDRDGARLAALFLPQSVWLSVLSDQAYAAIHAKSPTAPKLRVSSYTEFAKLLTSAKGAFNPTHSHVQVSSDGAIAAVYFDFVFYVDGKAQNRGSEAWQLVKGSEGWRIAAIIYSSNPIR